MRDSDKKFDDKEIVNEKISLNSMSALKRNYGSFFRYRLFRNFRTFTSFQDLSQNSNMVSSSFKTLVGYINQDNLQDFKIFLDNKKTIVDDRDENGTTALHVASSFGKIEFINELLNHGAEVNAEDNDSWTSLIFAAKAGHSEVCRILINHGAVIGKADMGGWTAMMWACYKGYDDVVLVLIDQGADVNASASYHITCLIWAAGRGKTNVSKTLIAKGAKVNATDKYGTTALIWASRRGDAEIVDCLLKAGANVDVTGMYVWTAVLVATIGNHLDVLRLLLEHKPNVNLADKDGNLPLTVACKEGYHEAAYSLLHAGAFINVQDNNGDTNLIHAVRNGHIKVVEVLLRKYANVDIPGKDGKTATYTAAEKGNTQILKLLLSVNPDLDAVAKGGDTALLRAVRSRDLEAVKLLLDHKARVLVCDDKGDTALHIAMRARSKPIVELLLKNPTHSQLLYRQNKAGQTPYNIDLGYQKSIMTQVFGYRKLNTNEYNEECLGYDLYSSALADVLSEPGLSLPIAIGLFAQWGSGKSFLLKKLTEEMKCFASQWIDGTFRFHWLLFGIVIHVALISCALLTLITTSWQFGLAFSLFVLFCTIIFIVILQYGSERILSIRKMNICVSKHMERVKTILQILFCHPPSPKSINESTTNPIRFYFTEKSKVSSTTLGENAIVQMIGSLCDAIELDYGKVPCRMFRACSPKPTSSSTWRWKKFCCIPNIFFFELNIICLLLTCAAFAVRQSKYYFSWGSWIVVDEVVVEVTTMYCVVYISVFLVSNLYTWCKILRALAYSQRKHIQKSISRLDTLKSEGFFECIRSEVAFLTSMIQCLDGYSGKQSRLVITMDGLECCEQDKVLIVLDGIHILFSESQYPFIILIVIDPHVISRVVEVNSKRTLDESRISSYNYLKTVVHLPFYLQNSGLRKVKVAQRISSQRKSTSHQYYDDLRRLSNESIFLGSSERLKTTSNDYNIGSAQRPLKSFKSSSRKLKLAESFSSSLASNMNRLGSPQDLSRMLLSDDYFSDVNPRSMRRLMNIIYVTGRLMKAFDVDFNWYRLATWINIIEQWPYRSSCVLLYHEVHVNSIDDSTPLLAIYEKVKPYVPISKEIEPLIEMDRDGKKFEAFLTFHRANLLARHIKLFLPFTINLDPYIQKVIKEDQQIVIEQGRRFENLSWINADGSQQLTIKPARIKNGADLLTPATAVESPHPSLLLKPPTKSSKSLNPLVHSPLSQLPEELRNIKISNLTLDGVCNLFSSIKEFENSQTLQESICKIRENKLSGQALFYCNLDELNSVMGLPFGDWQIFRAIISSLREQEIAHIQLQKYLSSTRFLPSTPVEETTTNNAEWRGSFSRSNSFNQGSNYSHDQRDGASRTVNKHSVIDKQISMEDQMLCGALQTLNEEACEDILEDSDEVKSLEDNEENAENSSNTKRNLIIENLNDGCNKDEETDVLYLQNSVCCPGWTPVNYDLPNLECPTPSNFPYSNSKPCRRFSSVHSPQGFLGSNSNLKFSSHSASLVAVDTENLETVTCVKNNFTPNSIVRSSSVGDQNREQRRGISNLTTLLTGSCMLPRQDSSDTLPILPTVVIDDRNDDDDDESTPLVYDVDKNYDDSSDNIDTQVWEETVGSKKKIKFRNTYNNENTQDECCKLKYINDNASLKSEKNLHIKETKDDGIYNNKWSDNETAV